MSQHSRSHTVVLNQIHECLRSTKETYIDSQAISIPNVRDRITRLYSDLLALDQDFTLYANVMATAAPTETYLDIERRIAIAKSEQRAQLEQKKRAEMNDLLHEDHPAPAREEDDVAFEGGESHAGLLCPLTQKLPTHPVVSRVCRHVFESDAIRGYIRSHATPQEKKVTCPMAGCTAMIGISDLVIDQEVSKRVAEAGKRQDKEWNDLK